jgi:hypothetical protein
MDSKKQKQQYLIGEILHKGYDSNDFAAFIAAEREGGNPRLDPGDDVDNWSITSLEDVVGRYKQYIETSGGKAKHNYEVCLHHRRTTQGR